MGNHTTVSYGDKYGLVMIILVAIIFGAVGISIFSFYTETYVLPSVDLNTAYFLAESVTPLRDMIKQKELKLVETKEIAYENITSPLFGKQGLNCLKGSQNNYLFTYNKTSGKSEADQLVVAMVSNVKPGGIFIYVGETFKTYCYKFEKDLKIT